MCAPVNAGLSGNREKYTAIERLVDVGGRHTQKIWRYGSRDGEGVA